MKQAHLFITGFVQGIGYRQFVKGHAKKVGLTGWVKNLPDKRVEAVLQGEKEILEKVILECKKGPFLSQVEEIEVIWQEQETTYSEFSILTS